MKLRIYESSMTGVKTYPREKILSGLGYKEFSEFEPKIHHITLNENFQVGDKIKINIIKDSKSGDIDNFILNENIPLICASCDSIKIFFMGKYPEKIRIGRKLLPKQLWLKFVQDDGWYSLKDFFDHINELREDDCFIGRVIKWKREV